MSGRVKWLLGGLVLVLVVALVTISFLIGKLSGALPSDKKHYENPTQDLKIRYPVSDVIIPKNQKPTLSVADIVKQSGDAVVYIATYSKIGLELGIGSGFVVSDDGKIVTNFHVIENAYSASVKLKNGDVYDDVQVIDHDERRDLAVIKINASNIHKVEFGNSDFISSGEKVIAIGNPAGLENSVSDGVVGGIRDADGYKVVQVTAPISPGSSGGAVFNSVGEVIGVSTFTLDGAQNLNFAIPINYVKPMLVKMDAIGLSDFFGAYQKKKWIGGKSDLGKKKNEVVSFDKSEDEVASLGLYYDISQPDNVMKIWSFKRESPARDAGLKPGDIIVEIDGHRIEGMTLDDKDRFFKSKKPGDTSTIKAHRGDQEVETKVTYTKLPEPTYIFPAILREIDKGKPVRLAVMVSVTLPLELERFLGEFLSVLVVVFVLPLSCKGLRC